MQLPASYMLTMFQDAREYDVLRLQVAQKDPGWETLQEVWFLTKLMEYGHVNLRLLSATRVIIWPAIDESYCTRLVILVFHLETSQYVKHMN